jgi:hypothetical protein
MMVGLLPDKTQFSSSILTDRLSFVTGEKLDRT